MWIENSGRCELALNVGRRKVGNEACNVVEFDVVDAFVRRSGNEDGVESYQ